MTKTINPYEALYTNLKNQFTVVYKGTEYTVGDFMLMKANKQSESALPIVASAAKTVSIASIVEYVNDKLTVKKPPVKDRTIRKFPLRTSFSAMLSATAACALILSCGIFALNGQETSTPYTLENSNNSYVENMDTNEEANEIFEYSTEKN